MSMPPNPTGFDVVTVVVLIGAAGVADVPNPVKVGNVLVVVEVARDPKPPVVPVPNVNPVVGCAPNPVEVEVVVVVAPNENPATGAALVVVAAGAPKVNVGAVVFDAPNPPN